MLGSVLVQGCTWFLVILGWLVVIDQTEHRELAKVSMARLAALRELLRSIEASAIKFHTTAFDQPTAEELMRSIKKLSEEVADLKRLGVTSVSMDMHLVEVRQAITLKNFDESTHKVLELRSSLVGSIQAVVDRADSALMRCASQACSTPRRLRTTICQLKKRF